MFLTAPLFSCPNCSAGNKSFARCTRLIGQRLCYVTCRHGSSSIDCQGVQCSSACLLRDAQIQRASSNRCVCIQRNRQVFPNFFSQFSILTFFVVFEFLGDPNALVRTKNSTTSPLHNWEAIPHLTPLNLCYDITPPELVTAVVTEVAILPCTSVPVILRIKPTEIGY